MGALSAQVLEQRLQKAQPLPLERMPGFWLASLREGRCPLRAQAVWKGNCLELWWQRPQVQIQGRVGGQSNSPLFD